MGKYSAWTPSYQFIETQHKGMRRLYAVDEIKWPHAPGLGILVVSERGNYFGIPENEPEQISPALMIRQRNGFGVTFEGRMEEQGVLVLSGVVNLMHIYSRNGWRYKVFPVGEVKR